MSNVNSIEKMIAITSKLCEDQHILITTQKAIQENFCELVFVINKLKEEIDGKIEGG